MPNPLQKSLKGYLTKIKRETGKLQLSSSNSFSLSKKWVLAKCKHPKKHRRRSSKTRFKDDDNIHQESGHAATLSDIDRFLQENFESLCIRDGEEDDGMTKKKEKMESEDEEDDYRHRFDRTWGPKLPDERPEFRKMERLSPTEGMTSMNTTPISNSSTQVTPENCIAVLKYTEEPHEEFKRSMVEMMEYKVGMQEEVDWDFMEDLLFSYLNLNNKKSHRFILSAFADLTILLREKEKTITRKSLVKSLSTRIAREKLRKSMSKTDSFRN